MKIILMGYMGSGKSTIGKVLADMLSHDFIDLDDYISKKESMKISEIFKKKGELYFRKRERFYLNEVLSSNKKRVISLGGGTPCYGNNLELIKNSENTISFYLKVSINVLAKRLFTEKDSRPLISHINALDELQEFIGKHIFERGFYYNQSDIVIETDNKTENTTVENIILNLI